jgi:hypothetical protein
MGLLRTIALACLVALAAAPALAADEARAMLDACRSVANDAERLACYDRAAERLLSQPVARAAPPPAPAPAPTPAPAPSAAPDTPAPTAPAAPVAAGSAATAAASAASAEENFGRERQIAYEETKRTRAVGELRATITDIETRIDGLMTFMLDNGQVWRQTRPDSKFSVKSGDPILIQPASLGSFILSGPTKKSTRVTRVK